MDSAAAQISGAGSRDVHARGGGATTGYSLFAPKSEGPRGPCGPVGGRSGPRVPAGRRADKKMSQRKRLGRVADLHSASDGRTRRFRRGGAARPAHKAKFCRATVLVASGLPETQRRRNIGKAEP